MNCSRYLPFYSKREHTCECLTFRYLLNYYFYEFIVHKTLKLSWLLSKANTKADTRSRQEIFWKTVTPAISENYRETSVEESIWTKYSFLIIFRNSHGSLCWKFSRSFLLLFWKRFQKKIVHFDIFNAPVVIG